MRYVLRGFLGRAFPGVRLHKPSDHRLSIGVVYSCSGVTDKDLEWSWRPGNLVFSDSGDAGAIAKKMFMGHQGVASPG